MQKSTATMSLMTCQLACPIPPCTTCYSSQIVNFQVIFFGTCQVKSYHTSTGCRILAMSFYKPFSLNVVMQFLCLSTASCDELSSSIYRLTPYTGNYHNYRVSHKSYHVVDWKKIRALISPIIIISTVPLDECLIISC